MQQYCDIKFGDVLQYEV